MYQLPFQFQKQRLIIATLVLALIGIAAHAQPAVDPAPKEVDEIIFSEETAEPLFEKIEDLTGKPILRKQNLPPVKITFNSQGPMTKADALLALESLLSINGIAITEVGDKFLKAVASNTVESEVPRMLSDELMTLEPSQIIYSTIFKLKFIDIEDARDLLTPFLNIQIGKMQIFPSLNSILATDALINLQYMYKLLDRLDRPVDIREEIIFYQLEFVNADEIKGTLESLQNETLKNYFHGHTTIDADERTNQLIIVTPPGNVEVFKSIIAKLDIDVAPLTQSAVIPVSNAEATVVADIIQQIITGQESNKEAEDADSSSAAAAESNRQARQGQGQDQGQGQGQRPDGGRPAQAPKVVAASTSDGSGAKLQFSEYIQVIADERSNSIVAYGTASDIKQVRELVENIDVILPQVRIEVVIAEVTLSEDQVRGIDSFGINVGSDGRPVLQTVTAPSSGTLDAPWSVNVVRGTFPDIFSLDMVFSTAARDSNVNVLSIPTIVTMHNKEAYISVGEQRPIITGSQSSLQSTNTVSQVSFEKIGIELTVTPLIGANNMIQMEIEQKIESVTGTVLIDNNEQPIIGSREARSFVSVADGEIIILGGLQEVQTSESEGKIFLLGSIPIIGEFFKSKTRSKVVRELILFIKPTIIKDPKLGTELTVAKIDTLETSSEVRAQLDTWKVNIPKDPNQDYSVPPVEIQKKPVKLGPIR